MIFPNRYLESDTLMLNLEVIFSAIKSWVALFWNGATHEYGNYFAKLTFYRSADVCRECVGTVVAFAGIYPDSG